MAENEPSETTPLLKGTLGSLEPGDAPNGALPSENRVANGHSHATGKNIDNVERQEDAVEDAVQHQGMPEVRKQLKYILPAIAVGVSLNQYIEIYVYAEMGLDIPICG